jgi:hypothetical protein
MKQAVEHGNLLGYKNVFHLNAFEIRNIPPFDEFEFGHFKLYRYIN